MLERHRRARTRYDSGDLSGLQFLDVSDSRLETSGSNLHIAAACSAHMVRAVRVLLVFLIELMN